MMPDRLPSEIVEALSACLSRHMGLHFPKERWDDLARGIEAVARDLQFKNSRDCANWLLSGVWNEELVQSLAKRLTVGETYFFRDPALFELLRQQILPPLIKAKHSGTRHIKIWSAGCSTGEEAYSIAILLDQVLPAREIWDVSILGTDINLLALEKAKAGQYGDWSFRNPPQWLRDNYFRKTNSGTYQIDPRIRRMVSFSYLNLADENYPVPVRSADIILCRNVLMYLDPQAADGIAHKLSKTMADNGWLIVTPAEISLIPRKLLSVVNFSGQILHHKQPAVVPEQQMQASSTPMQHRLKVVHGKPKTESLTKSTPQRSEYLQHMIVSLANKGELALALQHCEKALAHDRLNPGWHYLLAMILQECGQTEKAVSALHRALYLNQDFVMAHFALGNLCRQQGGYKSAARHLQNALHLLHGYNRDAVLPESDDMTAGRLRDMIRGFMNSMEKIA